MSIGGAEPQKFIKNAAGVRSLNPEWKAWKKAQSGGPNNTQFQAPAMLNEATALPIVTSEVDAQKHMQGVKLSDATEAAVEMLCDEDIKAEVGFTESQDPMVEIRRLFSKWEIPVAMLNKLMGLSDYQFMEMIIDDSGSMNANTDTRAPDGRWMTRWQEVHQRLTQMFEIMAFIPCPPCYIRFLNRSDVVECKKADGETPQNYLNRIMQAIGHQWQRPPSGTTPFKERIQESLGRCQGQSMLRYFFGDGQPNGGQAAERAITQMIVNRPNPQQNPITFMSCTNEDAQVEWMKECEEAAPFCAEYDDFEDESREVLGDQGNAFPYTFGMHLIGQLVGAFNPNDLDALDESVPMTASTLSNLLGYNLDEPSYQHYHRSFCAAQQAKPVESAADKLKKDYIPFWVKDYQQFFGHQGHAKDLPAAKAYHAALRSLAGK